MILEQRVFHEAIDISTKVNDFRNGVYVFPYVTGEYLYIASLFPLNNLFFEIGTANDVPAVPTIEIWWNQGWTPAVDVIDDTNGLFQTGRIQWNTNILKGWNPEQYSNDVDGVDPAIVIYNMYWMRISWDDTLKSTTSLKYIGQKFANDQILYSQYPDLNDQDIRDSYAKGQPSGTKTDWNEQHYMAAEHIIRELKRRSVIKGRAQLMDYSLFEMASVHKLAEIVYMAFGRPYFDQMQAARGQFKEEMNAKHFNVDVNATGNLEKVERKLSTGTLRR